MRADEVIQRFKETGALLEGHFILSSGLHSSTYLQAALAVRSPAAAAEFAGAIAAHFRAEKIETVAAPAIGGLVIGYEVARQLNVDFIWTEREDGRMTLRRGFTVREGARLLVTEDVITTGGSTRETIAALREAGAEVVAAAAIIDRSGGKAVVEVPLFALAVIDVPAVSPADCEACRRGERAVKPGSQGTVSSEQ